jgi:hypothetical protein
MKMLWSGLPILILHLSLGWAFPSTGRRLLLISNCVLNPN